MTKPKIKIFSFFAGSGFLDLGFELSGFEIVYVNELYSPFMEAYRYSRKLLKLSSPEYGYHQGEKGDVKQLVTGKTALNLGELIKDARKDCHIVGFIGGPPCPDFSIGGKNRGIHGDNGQLSGSYIELICQQQPDFFLFENVKGLYKTNKHRLFFETLKSQLKDANYFLTERLINAIEYGVPQTRERIILIGFHRNLINALNFNNQSKNIDCINQIFPWNKYIIFPRSQVFSYPWITTTPFAENSVFPFPGNVPIDLTVEHWLHKNQVNNHPNAQHYFKPRAGLKRFLSVDEGDDSKKSYKRLHRWRYSPTACYGNNEVHLHPYRARRISVAEALAIQSLPKEFIFPDCISLTAMFKTIGNGVPYLASKSLAMMINDFLNNPVDSIQISEEKQLELLF